MPNPAAAPTTDLKDTLEEMRASVAARGARSGLRGAIQEAILGFLETLLALLAEFRAGRLAAPASGDAAGGADGTVAEPSPSFGAGPRPGADGALALSSASMLLPPTSPDPSALEGRGEYHGADGAVDDPSPSLSLRLRPGADGALALSSASMLLPPTSPNPSALEGRGEYHARRFKVDHRAHPAAGAAVAGCARHSPRFPALRVGIKGGVERADSKNGVLGAGDSGELIVPE